MLFGAVVVGVVGVGVAAYVLLLLKINHLDKLLTFSLIVTKRNKCTSKDKGSRNFSLEISRSHFHFSHSPTLAL